MSSQVFPVFYCLMTRKTTAAYLGVFKFIEQKLFKLKPVLIMTDYEDGLRLGIRKHWPEVDIRGCWFHLKRAVNRKCKSFGLKIVIDKNSDARKVKNMLVNIKL